MNIFNQLIVSLLPLTPKPIVARFAKPYIAGENLADAVRTVKALNAGKAMATVDVLGEDITTREEAIAAREECKRVLAAIADNALESNISVKLTQLGLKIDTNFCRANVEEILEAAKAKNNFVRIDMEDHTCTDDTLKIFRAVKKNIRMSASSFKRISGEARSISASLQQRRPQASSSQAPGRRATRHCCYHSNLQKSGIARRRRPRFSERWAI